MSLKHQNIGEDGALEDAMVLRIIEMLKEQPNISQSALGERLGISRCVIQKYIKVLEEMGKIERKGGKRYGYWEVTAASKRKEKLQKQL